MKKHHKIQNVRFSNDRLQLTVDGLDKAFPLKDISEPLYKTTAEERNCFEISPSGYGIHWPLIDEDISIDGLLGVIHAPNTKRGIA